MNRCSSFLVGVKTISQQIRQKYNSKYKLSEELHGSVLVVIM